MNGDSFDLLGAGRNLGLIGRAYAWGPKGIDWDRGVAWNVYWLSPFDASSRVMRAKASAIPTVALDWLKPYAIRGGPTANWQFAVDDTEHALMGLRTYGSGAFSTTLFTLEASHAPAQVSRVDGEPFGQVGSAVRIGARWVVLQSMPATPERSAALSLFVIEGTSARLVARLPRITGVGSAATFRLATAPSDRVVGLVADTTGSAGERWVLPIKIDSGEVLDPESLGLVDLTDRAQLRGCDPGTNASGYRFDAPVNGSVGIGDAGSIYNVLARLHVSQRSACVEAVSGNYNQSLADIFHLGAARLPKTPASPDATDKNEAFPVSVAVSGTRQLLRCRSTR